MEAQPFRILSLDGGGIMGAFSASALATFERVTGRRIVEHFDLITGTSTGGIIAIGLAMGASPRRSARSPRRPTVETGEARHTSPQPTFTSVMNDLPTGKVAAAKKSRPSSRMAS